MKFELFVTYSQIAIFNSNLDNPFNDWSDQHVSQGFSWREESVSFKTIVDGEKVQVELIISEEFDQISESIRIISVPFHCNSNGNIEISTISDGTSQDIPPGDYRLIFQTGGESGENWCKFTLVPEKCEFADIIRSDSDITATPPFLMQAHSA